METHDDQSDDLSGLSDMDFVGHPLTDLHDDLPEKVGRVRMLTDLDGQLGPSGAMDRLDRHKSKACEVRGGDQNAGTAVGVGKGVRAVAQAAEILRWVVCRGGEIGLIQRLPVPDRHARQGLLSLVLQKRVTAGPRRIDRPVQQGPRDFLIGPALDKVDVASYPFGKC